VGDAIRSQAPSRRKGDDCCLASSLYLRSMRFRKRAAARPCCPTSHRPVAASRDRWRSTASRRSTDIYRRLKTSPADSQLDLFLHSNGGESIVPWRMLTLLREFCREFTVLGPHHAADATGNAYPAPGPGRRPCLTATNRLRILSL